LWNQGVEFPFREEEFLGRDEERAALLRVSLEGRAGAGSSVLVFGPPNIGKTSLLLKLKAELLALPEGAAEPRPFPFYFSFSKILSHPLALSRHFLQECLWQLVVFLGETPSSGFDAEGLCERLADTGVAACRELLEAHRKYSERGDGLSALVTALSFPFTLAGGRVYPVLLFDDFQYTHRLQGIPEGAVISILRPYIKSGRHPVILSGSSPGYVTAALKREGLFGAFQLMRIGGLDPAASLRLWPALFERRRIEVPAHLLPRASERVGFVPIYQRMLAEEISFANAAVRDAADFENLYARSITEGKLNRYWREFFETSFPARAARARAVRFLKRVLCDRFPLDTYDGAVSLMGVPAEEGGEILATLEFRGLVSSDYEHLDFVDDPVLADFLFWAFERGVLGKGSSQVAAALVQEKLARAGAAEAGRGRERLVSAVKEMMRRWDCREVPRLFFDYGAFREKFGGRGLLEVVIGMEAETDRIRLPKVSSASAGYRTRKGGVRFDFDIVAYGFEGGEFSESNLVIWAVDVAAEPALSVAAVDHFEDRCRVLAFEQGLAPERFRKWIVFDGSPAPGAVERAGEYGILLTHRSQLKVFLNAFGLEDAGAQEGPAAPAAPPSAAASAGAEPLEIELVLPMKGDTEVVAARVAEEVAAYASLDPDTVDRIKMALIEACINAFEHSGAESGKVHLRYVLSPEKIELFVRDEGKGFRPSPPSAEGRRNRGWGLKLIRELVDDLDITTGETGTVVRMVKYLDFGRGGATTAGNGESR